MEESEWLEINSDKELFIAHTQERMENLVGESGNEWVHYSLNCPNLSHFENCLKIDGKMDAINHKYYFLRNANL